MSAIHHLDPITFTRPSADTTIASTDHMTPSTDRTVAPAWSSSSLGDPATDDGYLSELAESPPAPITPAERRLPVGKNTVVAAAVIAAIGAGATALGLAIISDTGPAQPKPVVVAPGSAAVPAAPQPPAVVPPATVAPAPPPVITQPDNGQASPGAAGSSGYAGSSSGGNATDPAPAGPPSNGPAPTDPGSPPASAPTDPGSPVTVNIPIGPVPVPVPVPVPIPSGGQQNSGQQNSGQQNSGQQNSVSKVCIPCKGLTLSHP
jgi:hypothetical protein